jgi:hypothetical protein
MKPREAQTPRSFLDRSWLFVRYALSAFVIWLLRHRYDERARAVFEWQPGKGGWGCVENRIDSNAAIAQSQARRLECLE